MIQPQGLHQLPWELPWVPAPPLCSAGCALPAPAQSVPSSHAALPQGLGSQSCSGLHTCILLTYTPARKALACEHIFVQ